MNPDLLMGDELLKKSGAGNLFTVFGEPDVDVRRQPDGKLEVEARGVDVYDPTTQEIRSHSTEEHRLLVHRHGVQRRELFRTPRLLYRSRRDLAGCEASTG